MIAGLVLGAGGCKGGESGGGDGGDAGGKPANCPSNFPDDLISDFSLDNALAGVNGRQGGWYTYGDPVGTFANTATGFDIDHLQGNTTCSGPGSLHVKGTGFSEWGAAMGADFRPRPSNGDGGYLSKMTYDASAYKGIAFWAKASAPLDGVQISFPDLYTDGAAPPHAMTDPVFPDDNKCTDCVCIYNGTSWMNCSPYLVQFGKKGDGGAAVAFAKYMDVQIDTTWKRYEILFADTRQDPGNLGYHTPEDKLAVNAITAMAIQINKDYDAMAARDFEIWLDDVSFIK